VNVKPLKSRGLPRSLDMATSGPPLKRLMIPEMDETLLGTVECSLVGNN